MWIPTKKSLAISTGNRYQPVRKFVSSGANFRVPSSLAQNPQILRDRLTHSCVSRVQTTDKRDLPRRMRYYQSVIDQEVLKPGAHYRSLPPSYVIFICGFDPFGLDRCVYTFENRCLEVPQLGLGDGAVKVLVNIRGLREGVSAELRELLDYLSTGTVSGPASRVLSNAVDHVKQSEERRREYMLSMVRDMELKAEAREEGRQEGRQEGRAEGIVQLSALVDKLLALGRIDDISRVTKDAEYRDKLLKEYQLA